MARLDYAQFDSIGFYGTLGFGISCHWLLLDAHVTSVMIVCDSHLGWSGELAF